MCLCLTESTPEQHLRVLQRYEPEFISHVEQARREQAAVTLVLDGYRNNREIVWACLWYAMEQGVMVTVVPRVARMPHQDERRSGPTDAAPDTPPSVP